MELPSEKNLSLLKRYLYEIALFSMGVCIAYLFIRYDNLNSYIRDKSTVESVNNRVALGESTKMIQENTRVMTELVFLIKEQNNLNNKSNSRQ